jgi:hypothetical protein
MHTVISICKGVLQIFQHSSLPYLIVAAVPQATFFCAVCSKDFILRMAKYYPFQHAVDSCYCTLFCQGIIYSFIPLCQFCCFQIQCLANKGQHMVYTIYL